MVEFQKEVNEEEYNFNFEKWIVHFYGYDFKLIYGYIHQMDFLWNFVILKDNFNICNTFIYIEL